MKDNSGFTNWETERMFTHARNSLIHIPLSMETLVEKLRSHEDSIAKEGRKHFILYEGGDVNYWEVYARLVITALQDAHIKFLVPGYKELTNNLS